MRKCFLIKYKDRDGNIETMIDREPSGVGIKSLIYDMKKELQRYQEIEYPTFAIEEITEEQYYYFRKKGYYTLGE